jgi:membrane protease YdiL (CAAX protease family)
MLDPQAARAPRFPHGSRARLVFAFALLMALALNIVIVLGIVPRLLGMDRGDLFRGGPGSFVVLAAGMAYGMGVVTLGLLVGYGRVPLDVLGWRFDKVGADLGAGLLGALACVGVFLAVTPMFFDVTPGDLVEGFAAFSVPQHAMFVLIGIMAAFSEESVFRGHLQPQLLARMPAPAAIALQAALFSVYHLEPHPAALLCKFAFGCVYGALAHHTKGLLAPAVAHFVFWQIVGFS